ncbi:MAG: hypothetical protein SynsKO_15340 [Synoicihabitans sp.]
MKFDSPSEPDLQLPANRWWSRTPLAWGVLVLTVGLTAMAWGLADRFSSDLAHARFERRTANVETLIRERMQAYEQVLVGGVALMRVKPDTTREEWKTYVDRLRLEELYPGIQGMGFAVPVAPEDVDTHIAQIRAEGFPDYKITPETPRDEYSAIIYLEPFDWRNQRAFGYDMWSNPMRREAMRRARDQATAAISGAITLVQETEDDVQRGFLYYLPFYDPSASTETIEQRQNAFIGWVYAAFRAGDLMAEILRNTEGDFEFEIYDEGTINSDSLIYDSDASDTLFSQNQTRLLSQTFDMEVGHRKWAIYVHSKGKFLTPTEEWGPLIVVVGGGLINLLLFLVIVSLTTVQSRAKRLAIQMTERLQTQAAELEVRNKELSEFAYIASHDLQEPIQTIRSSIGMLLKKNAKDLDATSAQLMSFVEKSSERMHRLVHGLLHYSRLGRSTEPVPINVNKVVANVMADASTALDQTKAQLKVEKLPILLGHEQEIHTLFQSLITNALKYHRVDTPLLIEISATPGIDEWVLHVRDNGIGIDPLHFDKIFKIFQRLHLQNEIPGTGIGLANCKKIMALHSGRIWVESKLGEGSTFHLAFPVRFVVG